jgi:hypothetical protein
MIVALRPAALGALALVAGLQASWPAFEPVQPDLLGAGGTLVNAFADFDLDEDPSSPILLTLGSTDFPDIQPAVRIR